jgi:hypothetical protein
VKRRVDAKILWNTQYLSACVVQAVREFASAPLRDTCCCGQFEIDQQTLGRHCPHREDQGCECLWTRGQTGTQERNGPDPPGNDWSRERKNHVGSDQAARQAAENQTKDEITALRDDLSHSLTKFA